LAQPYLHDFFGGTPAKLPLSTFMPRADKEAERPFLPKTALEMVRQGEMPSHPFLTGITSQVSNFINILQAAFSYKSVLRSFFLIAVWLC